MVLRYQRTSSYKDQSSSDTDSQNDEMQKWDEWTFLPDPLVDSVFSLSDDVESEGTFA